MCQYSTTNPKSSTITVQPGQYWNLADDFVFPDQSFLIGETGIGKTTAIINYCLRTKQQFIIIVQTQIAAKQIEENHPELDARYEGVKTGNRYSPGIVCVVNSFPQLSTDLDIDQNRFGVFNDECQNHASSSGYKPSTMQAAEDAMLNGDWKFKCFMTATPLPLTNPAYKNFSTIKISSVSRLQKARFVTWDDKNVTRQDAVISQCDPKLKHILLINDINQSVEEFGPKLEAIGFKKDDILFVNAETKHTDPVQQLVKTGKTDAKVIIGTNILLESISIYSPFDRTHVVTKTHPLLAHQLANRLRIIPSEVCIYSNGDGKQVDYDYPFKIGLVRNEASLQLSYINTLDDVDPNDTSVQAEIKRGEIDQYARKNKYIRTQNGQWKLYHAKMDYEVFQASTTYFYHNPHAYKRQLRGHNWKFGKPIHVTKPCIAGDKKASVETVTQNLREARKQRYVERVEETRKLGLMGAENELEIRLKEPGELHVIADVVRLTRALVGDDYNSIWQTYDEQFQVACDLALTTEGSKRKLHTLIRMIKARWLKVKGGEFTTKIYQTFNKGERLTNTEIHERFVNLFKSNRIMWVFALDVYQFRNSKDKTNMLTERQAVRLAGELFELKRTKNSNGENCYEFVSDDPLSQFSHLVSILLRPLSEKSPENAVLAMA